MKKLAQIDPGARVEARDGTLGLVQRLERDPDGVPLHLRVREAEGARTVVVPVGLVREVDDEGTVWLGATADEARTFTPGAADATQRLEPPASPPGVSVALRREELVARVEARELRSVVVRTEIEEVPGRVEVEATREEIELEHIPVGAVVRERVDPWWEEGDLVIPLYDERVAVSKELVLRETLRVRRVLVEERRSYADTLRQERLVVDDPERTEVVREFWGDDRGGVLRSARNLLSRLGRGRTRTSS